MSISRIILPLPGERVVALSPQDAAEAAVTWLRRPNLFPGRALTAPTLEARNRWTSGHVVERGQAFTPGVVRGLEVGFTTGESPAPGQRRVTRLRVGAGQGLAASGEDVVVLRPMDVDFWGLPVVAPPAVFEGGGFGSGGVLQPRSIGPTLGELLGSHPDALPVAGVLVLQPTETEQAAIDPADPCDRCCDDDVVDFEDWRLADAARLLWYAWPEDWRPLPPAGPRLRNDLAYTIFDAERALAPGAVLPWEEIGVPIALLGVGDGFLPTFADRAAVVRQGGRARYSRLQLAGTGANLTLTTNPRLPALWQAQIDQLAEQITELGDPAPAPDVLAQAFDRLPPCGLLPANIFDRTQHRSAFFPGGFDLDAVPVPFEQLDLALRESAGLAPLDLAGGERVRLLVPVSQASWEPRLLQTEEIDPEFQTTLDHFLMGRSRALAGRQSVRVKSSVLLSALRGSAPPVPAIGDDPQAVEPETLGTWGPPAGATGGHRSVLQAGVHGHGFGGATTTLTAVAGDTLYAWVYIDPDNPPREVMLEWRVSSARRQFYWGEDLIGADARAAAFVARSPRVRIGDLPATGQWVRLEVPADAQELVDRTINGMTFVVYDGRAAWAGSGRLNQGTENPWFDAALPAGATADGNEPFDFITANELLAPFEDRQGVVPGDDSTKFPVGVSATLRDLAANPALTGLLSNAEQAQLPRLGVEGFIAYLKSRADRADDLVDYGFLKIQTDIYRVRQLVLGTTDATRLAVSPTLAGIAKAETATASQEDISTLFQRLRTSGTTATTEATGAPSTQPLREAAFVAPTEPVPVAPSRALNVKAAVFTAPLGEISATTVSTTTKTQAMLSASATELLKQQSVSEVLTRPLTYTPTDIRDAAPLVGNYDVRTLSIAERLAPPKAQEARDYSTSSRHEAVLGLVRLADQLRAQDGELPGLFKDIVVWGLATDTWVAGGDDPVQRLQRPLLDFITGDRADLFGKLLSLPVRQGADEAALFSDSADIADRTVALLRQVEGRVKRYRDAIAACEAAASTLRSDTITLGTREQSWGELLANARHDVAVTRALMAEEQARVDGINSRRAQVLEKEVRFIAYVRPRATDTLAPAASRPLNPGLLEAPAPTCLRENADVPDELRDMLLVVREAPADWFRLQTRLLDGLDRVDLLVKAVRTAQVRTQLAQAPAPVLQTGLAAAIGAVQLRQQQQVSLVRAQSLQLDLTRLSTLTWQGVRAEASKVVSLGDLIDGQHGNGLVARNAAAFFDRFGHICACLHGAFSDVLPVIRLDWAEILSEFDRAANLRNLSILPRWPEIEYADRRRMQALVDWLFDQLTPSEPRALDLVNDVVRMTLLLASHAPVGRIIAGRLPRPITVRPGIRLPLVALDPARLRVGMQALVYRGDAIVARGVVEDLGQEEASARVTYTVQDTVDLDETVRVQFAAAAEVSLGAATTALRAGG